MGLVTGYICFICFILLAAKYIAKRAKNQSLNRFFMKIHKPVSGIFFLVAIIHFASVLKVWHSRNLLVNLSGMLSFGMAILLILFCHTIKDTKKKMFWHRVFTAAVFLLVVLHMVAYLLDFVQYQQCIQNIDLQDVDISAIADGQYEGEYDAGYIYAKVCVSIENGEVTKIDLLEHRTERGQRAERIVDDIVKEQRITVDAISGATNSSFVIEKACENALK